MSARLLVPVGKGVISVFMHFVAPRFRSPAGRGRIPVLHRWLRWPAARTAREPCVQLPPAFRDPEPEGQPGLGSDAMLGIA